MADLPNADQYADRIWLAVGAGPGYGCVIGIADNADGQRCLSEEAAMLRYVKVYANLLGRRSLLREVWRSRWIRTPIRHCEPVVHRRDCPFCNGFGLLAFRATAIAKTSTRLTS